MYSMCLDGGKAGFQTLYSCFKDGSINPAEEYDLVEKRESKQVLFAAVFPIRIRIHLDPFRYGSPGSELGIRIRIRIQDSQNGVQEKKIQRFKVEKSIDILIKAYR